MEFVFEISEYDKNITAQVAKGIRLCAEERSREVLPGVWELTEKMTAAGMEAPGVRTSYEQFRWVMETKDTFLFVQGEQMTVLQKKDIKRGSAEELRGFLERKKLSGTGLIRINT